MSDHRLKVGIAGYGVVGKRRRESIDQHQALKTTAVCDMVFPEDGIFPDEFVITPIINVCCKRNWMFCLSV